MKRCRLFDRGLFTIDPFGSDLDLNHRSRPRAHCPASPGRDAPVAATLYSDHRSRRASSDGAFQRETDASAPVAVSSIDGFNARVNRAVLYAIAHARRCPLQ